MKPETMQRLERVTAEFQSVAEAVRADTNEVSATNDHVEIIRHFNSLRTINQLIKKSREALSGMEDDMSKVRIPEVMADHDIKTITIEDVGRVTVAQRFNCSMLDKEEGMGWLDANGHGGLIQRTVNSGTLSAFAKDLMENQGLELPEDLFKVSMSKYTSITKVK